MGELSGKLRDEAREKADAENRMGKQRRESKGESEK